MKMTVAAGLIAGLACISAAEAPSNYMTFGNQRVVDDEVTLQRFGRALDYCVPQALTPPRGTPDRASFYYNTALRNCLYRLGYIDRGSHAYPVNLYLGHGIGR